jgi:hypothetical protein
MRFFAVALFLGSVLTVDWTVNRRSDVTFDGTKLTLNEGEDRNLPCGHSPGKTHRVRVEPAKVYQFNGFGTHFDFGSTMSIQVESNEQCSTVRAFDPSGSGFMMRVHNTTPEGDVLGGLAEAMLTGVQATDVVRKPVKVTVAGEELEGLRVDFTGWRGTLDVRVTQRFFWKPIGKGGRLGVYIHMTEAGNAALATIEKSLRFDKG